MTMGSSFLTTKQNLQEDLGLRSTVNDASIEKAIHKLVPDQESAVSLSAQFLTMEPAYRSISTRVLVPRAGSYEVFDIQVKAIEDRMVLSVSSTRFSKTSLNDVLKAELQSWLLYLIQGENKDALRSFPALANYRFSNLNDIIDSISHLVELHGLIGFDRLKSYFFISEFDVHSFETVVEFYKKSLHLACVRDDPVMSLYFFCQMLGRILGYNSTEKERENCYEALLSFVQLPHFSFDLFHRMISCMSIDSTSDGFKNLNNLKGLIESGHLSFSKLQADYDADQTRRLELGDVTDAFCRALMKGYISLDLSFQDDYDDCYPGLFLRESSDRDKDLNRAFEGLYERLEQNPAFKGNPQKWHALVNNYLKLLQIPGVDTETGMMIFSEETLLLFQLYKEGEITAEKLYQEIIKLEVGLRRIYDEFVATNEVMLETSDLRKLFTEGPEVFSLYEFIFFLSISDAFESDETRKGISSLSQLTDIMLKLHQKKTTEFFSKALLETFISLKPEEIRRVIRQIKEIDRADGTEPGLIQIVSHILKLKIKRLSVDDIQHFIFFALLRMKELKALMREEGIPIQETHFLVSIEFVPDLLNEELAREMLKSVFELDQQIQRDHIQFLKKSTLEILCKESGSRIAAYCFDKMCNETPFLFLRALCLLSLQKISQEDWVHYLKYFVSFQYRGLRDEDGSVSFRTQLDCLDSFDSFITLALKQSLAGNELDLHEIATKVQNFNYDSSDESSDQEVSSEDSDSESE